MGLGYSGFMRLGGENGTVMLTTGGGMNLVLEPIYSNAVWGAGWYNASTGHYADGALRYEGSVDAEMQATTTIWNFIRDWAIEQRAYGQSIDYSPDGHVLMSYTATSPAAYDKKGVWLKGMTMNTSPNSAVSVSLDCLALERTTSTIGGGTYISNQYGIIGSSCVDYNQTKPLNTNGDNISPIPFWKTKAEILVNTGGGYAVPQVGLEALDWNVSVSNSPYVLYTCDGTRDATAILMGAIEGSATTTLYRDGGVFDPIAGPSGLGTPAAPYLYASNTKFVVTLNVGGTPQVTLTLPAVVVGSDTYQISGQSDPVTRAFSMRGLASCTGSHVDPPVLMSLAT